jgi:23S rRNA (pseudouridine1915-N3)-methyltransferase
MKIQIIHPGSFKESYLTEAFAEYTKRISAYADFSDITVKERQVTEMSQVEKALEDEGEDILSKLDPRAYVIALCIEGKELSSEELSETFEKASIDGFSNITFIIGSSHGLSQKVKKRAHLKLSFSKMTFPHQLMRVILTEQIYRAFSIINGSKYHK